MEEMQLEKFVCFKIGKESKKDIAKKPSLGRHTITDDDFQMEVQIYNQRCF